MAAETIEGISKGDIPEKISKEYQSDWNLKMNAIVTNIECKK